MGKNKQDVKKLKQDERETKINSKKWKILHMNILAYYSVPLNNLHIVKRTKIRETYNDVENLIWELLYYTRHDIISTIRKSLFDLYRAHS